MAKKILEIKNVFKEFPSKSVTVKAVSNVSFDVYQGETVGIVGESGCGKTTLGRCVVRAIPATGGEVLYHQPDGETYEVISADKKTVKKFRKDLQMIFQDPYSSLDPRMMVIDIIKEPLLANYPKMDKKEMEDKVKAIASKVGLEISYLNRYPHAFSGGQRQRIGIARALILNPHVIVCDEAVSALDVSIQAQVINLLKDLQEELNLTYLFISHDLSVVEHISDKVGVMYLGKIVEYGTTEVLFQKPKHPYTAALLSAVLVADPDMNRERIFLKGEIPNPADPPTGCYFHTRCQYCTEKCKTEDPVFMEIEKDHYVACHYAKELDLKGFDYEK